MVRGWVVVGFLSLVSALAWGGPKTHGIYGRASSAPLDDVTRAELARLSSVVSNWANNPQGPQAATTRDKVTPQERIARNNLAWNTQEDRGALRVVVRRVLQIPHHLMPRLVYKITKDADGIHVTVDCTDPQAEIGVVDFTLDGKYSGHDITDRPVWEAHQLIQNKRADETTNYNPTHDEMAYALKSEGKDKNLNLQIQGELKYLAKELFNIENKALPLSAGRGYGQPGKVVINFTVPTEKHRSVGTIEYSIINGTVRTVTATE